MFEAMKKRIQNPEWENARYEQRWIFAPNTPKAAQRKWKSIRTNNPNYITDGCKEQDQIPQFIRVDV